MNLAGVTAPLSDKRSQDAFARYQQNTNDAWDQDDLQDVRLSMEAVKTSAIRVMRNHSDQISNNNSQTKPQFDRSTKPAAKSQASSAPLNSSATSYSTNPRTAANHSNSVVGVKRPAAAAAGPSPVVTTSLPSGAVGNGSASNARIGKFHAVLSSQTCNLEEIRKLAWSGVPSLVRPSVWKILCGYLPGSQERRETMQHRKRAEYASMVKQYFDSRYLDAHKDTYRQIHIDIPRMNPLIAIFQQKVVQDLFERVLFIWAIRHPASGYVQGMNDLVTPFFVVFLTEFIDTDVEVESVQVEERLAPETLAGLEADCFWCMNKLMDGIQDNYTFAQPGIQRNVRALEDLMQRIDEKLHRHLKSNQIEYLQFAFRWMNNLLMRELPLRCVIRLWDTYQAEPAGFSELHLYVCAALLLHFSADLLRERDFQGLMMLLQNLPTHHWHNDEIGLLLADAYRLKYTFSGAPSHLQSSDTVPGFQNFSLG